MLHANAAENQRPSFREPMGVVTDADGMTLNSVGVGACLRPAESYC